MPALIVGADPVRYMLLIHKKKSNFFKNKDQSGINITDRSNMLFAIHSVSGIFKGPSKSCSQYGRKCRETKFYKLLQNSAQKPEIQYGNDGFWNNLWQCLGFILYSGEFDGSSICFKCEKYFVFFKD